MLGVLAQFPREQVLVLQYEQCVVDTDRHVRKTLEFIGLDPADWHSRRPSTEKVNGARGALPELDAATCGAIAAHLAGDLEVLGRLCPEVDLSRWATADLAAGTGAAR
jgi:hypothetical protein